MPEHVAGHFVIIGAHPRIQHYVVALRRQRPSVVIVVVVDTEVSYSPAFFLGMGGSIMGEGIYILYTTAP